MIPEIPGYIAAVVIAGNIAIAIAVSSVIARAAGGSGLPPAAERRVRNGSALFLGGWLAAVLWLAPTSSSLPDPDPFAVTPLIPLFILLLFTVSLIALWRSASLRRVLAAVPLSTLCALQVWRVIGIVFVILLAEGQLPAHFALPAGWGDVGVGVTAPLVALALARRARGATALAIGWNIFGLLDLVVAVGMGTGLLAPLLVPDLGPRVPPAAAMGLLPMMLVPAFAVPVSVMVHVLALARLVRGVRRSPGFVPAASH